MTLTPQIRGFERGRVADLAMVRRSRHGGASGL
jgi:hypothetical protein